MTHPAMHIPVTNQSPNITRFEEIPVEDGSSTKPKSAAAAADAGIALMLKLAATLTELDHPQADDFLVAHGTRTRATSHSHKASPESTI